jgi:hypothetical protein
MKRPIIRIFCVFLWVASATSASTAARADSARIELCESAGDACNPEYTSNGQPTLGTCMTGVPTGPHCQATCGPDPASSAGNGGSANSTQASCLYCLLKSSDGTGGSTTGAANVLSEPPFCGDSSSDSGCSVRRLGTEKGIAGLLLALGLAALAVSRKKPSA